MPKPHGLSNNGNTCYFNATLQNLYRTTVFRTKLYQSYDCWKQKNQEPVVNESTSSENSFGDRFSHYFRNGEFKKCFLLCLAYLGLYKAGPSGRVGIDQDVHQQPDEAISEAISVALTRLFGKIDCRSEGSCHNPRSVLEAVCRRSNRFLGFRQQDSHELLRHLLDGIREEERNLQLKKETNFLTLFGGHFRTVYTSESCPSLKEETKSLTLVDRVFGGHFRTVYTCETCSLPYCLYEAFLDISLPITLHEDTLKEISETDNNEILTSTVMSQQHNIEFWLKVFTRSENLGKQYLCSVCNASSTGDNYFLTCGKKQTLICDPPAILCIHVKRFRKTAGDFVKANDHVEFSEYLDLKPYLTDDCRRLGENKEIVMYALYGVVVHSGSLESGHYTAYIKSQTGHGQDITADNTDEFLQQEGFDWDSLPTGTIGRLKTESLNIQQNSSYLNQTRKWYYCSDSTVMPVAADEVLKQAAYLLFYERLC